MTTLNAQIKPILIFENLLLSHDTKSAILQAKKKKARFFFLFNFVGSISVKSLSVCKSFACLKEEQSMKQNGSLCSVIVGNLVVVSLATQT